MAEELIIDSKASKKEKYDNLLPQIQGLINDESNLIANLSNICGALKETFDFFWVGFYLVDSEEELVLGPFQGPIACTRIKKGKGVCGTAWEKSETQLVPNVEEYPGHIACNSASKSEIVIPFTKDGKIIGVLDVDSDLLDDFDEIDNVGLSNILNLIR